MIENKWNNKKGSQSRRFFKFDDGACVLTLCFFYAPSCKRETAWNKKITGQVQVDQREVLKFDKLKFASYALILYEINYKYNFVMTFDIYLKQKNKVFKVQTNIKQNL